MAAEQHFDGVFSLGRNMMGTVSVGARIAGVAEGSPAAEAGIRLGDELVSLNSHPVRDILDYRFEAADEQVVVGFRRDGHLRTFVVSKDPSQDLGLEFEEELFDGLRTCENHCIFCFLHQMPKSLRASLYVRDDDYRLSFTQGNYVTLTNLSDADMERMCSQKLSPIYVSVHATDPELRAEMLGNPGAARIMKQLNRLAEARITVHAQIVLCPGVNDGEYLTRSIGDLSELYPWVASIALVPVGLTKHRARLTPLRMVDNVVAREVVALCRRWQREFKARFGARLVFPSDELYLLSGRPIPSRAVYEGFRQLEDGVGLCRVFLDELAQVRRRLNGRIPSPRRYVLVTGTLAASLVERLAATLGRIPGVHARVCEVANEFLGESVTVAGLMAGRDIARALGRLNSGEEVLIPSVALNGDRFLDGVSLEELQASVAAEVGAVAPSPIAVWKHVIRYNSTSSKAVFCAGAEGTRVQE